MPFVIDFCWRWVWACVCALLLLRSNLSSNSCPIKIGFLFFSSNYFFLRSQKSCHIWTLNHWNEKKNWLKLLALCENWTESCFESILLHYQLWHFAICNIKSKHFFTITQNSFFSFLFRQIKIQNLIKICHDSMLSNDFLPRLHFLSLRDLLQ